MNKYEELAELIFPNVTTTVEELETFLVDHNYHVEGVTY